MSKIRVTFNRQLTFAEIETFREDVAEVIDSYPTLKWHFREGRDQLYIETSEVNSRMLYALVADWADRSVVNLHAIAVRTFSD